MKILMVCSNLQTHGITNVVMNYLRYFNAGKVDVEICAGEIVEEKYITEIANLGYKLYVLPKRRKHIFKYRRALKKIIKQNNYDIVHVHGNSATMVLELSVAKKYRVPVRIAHCHNSVCGNMLRHKLLYPFFKKSYTDAFACSELAGNWIFGENNFTVIKNGFVTERFVFDGQKRERYRRELGLEDSYVIGHVGRFNSQKNHRFLLNVFEELIKTRQDARLLLVGSGPDFEEICDIIDNAAYKDKVIIYGVTDDVAGLMSAMDVFALPSKYEGLGIVAVEAQINSLPIICSAGCPQEINLTDLIRFVPLDDAVRWVEELSSVVPCDREQRKTEYLDEINKAGYSISDAVKKLEDIYCETVKN